MPLCEMKLRIELNFLLWSHMLQNIEHYKLLPSIVELYSSNIYLYTIYEYIISKDIMYLY